MSNAYTYINFNSTVAKKIGGNDDLFRTDEELRIRARNKTKEFRKRLIEKLISDLRKAKISTSSSSSHTPDIQAIQKALENLGIDYTKINNYKKLNGIQSGIDDIIAKVNKGKFGTKHIPHKRDSQSGEDLFGKYIKGNLSIPTNKELSSRLRARSGSSSITENERKMYETNSHGYTRKALQHAQSVRDNPNASKEARDAARGFLNNNAGISERSILKNGVSNDVTMRSMDDVVTAQEAIRSNALTNNEVKNLNRASRELLSKRYHAQLDKDKADGKGGIGSHIKHGASHLLAQAGNLMANVAGKRDGITADNVSRFGRWLTNKATNHEGNVNLDADPIKNKKLMKDRSKELTKGDNNTRKRKTTYGKDANVDEAMYSEYIGINNHYESFSSNDMKYLTELSNNGFPNPVNLNNTIQGKLSAGEYKDINNYKLQPDILSIDDIEYWLKSPSNNLF